MSSTTATPDRLDTGATNVVRIAIGLAGLTALIVGILILVWPAKTAVVVTAIIAIYAILTGLVYGAMTLFSKAKSGWWRIGHAILALIFVAAGISALSSLRATAAFLALFLAILVGMMWIIEGVVSLTTLGQSQSKGWTVFFAVLSIVAGMMLFISPVWGAIVLWWLLGISFVILGAIQIGRALTIGKAAKA